MTFPGDIGSHQKVTDFSMLLTLMFFLCLFLGYVDVAVITVFIV